MFPCYLFLRCCLILLLPANSQLLATTAYPELAITLYDVMIPHFAQHLGRRTGVMLESPEYQSDLSHGDRPGCPGDAAVPFAWVSCS